MKQIRKLAYKSPVQETIEIKVNEAIAVTSHPTEPIIEDPEDEI